MLLSYFLILIENIIFVFLIFHNLLTPNNFLFGNLKQKKYNKKITIILCNKIEHPIINDCPTSSPLIPAYILIEFVQKTASIAI